jgi:hypothetical protein
VNRPWRLLLLTPLAAMAMIGQTLWTKAGEPGERPAGHEAAGDAGCTQTLSPNDRLAAAISKAGDGATLCLRAGSYRLLSLDRVEKSPPVTVRSLPGERASVAGIEIDGSSGLRFARLDIEGGVGIEPSGSRLQLIANDITGPRGVYMFGDYRIGKRVERVLIARNRIHHIDYAGSQQAGYGYGVEGIGDTRHVVVRGNTIASTASDYMQSASPVDWRVEGNTFLGPSLLGSHEDHQDLWQIFGGGHRLSFAGNVARDTETQESLLFQEGAFSDVVVEDNLFDHDSRGYTCQIYQSRGLVFRRNTIVGSRWGCLFRDDRSLPPGSGYRVLRNIFAATRDGADVSTEGRAASWGVYDRNVSSDGSAAGRHSLRNWHPAWRNQVYFPPLQLPFSAGYRP